MFIYSLAELKDGDSSQKFCVIYHFKWFNTSESRTPGEEDVQKALFFFFFCKNQLYYPSFPSVLHLKKKNNQFFLSLFFPYMFTRH